MRDLLAHCADIRAWGPGFRYAAELAANLGAALTCVHVSPPLPAREPKGIPTSVLAEFIAYSQEEVQAAMVAGSRYAAWARDLGVPSMQWQVALGDPLDVLGAAGNWSDAIILERHLGEREDTTELICNLLLSGFACIAVPENAYAIGRLERVVVAFDGSPNSIRALQRAMPMLLRSLNVILLRGDWSENRGAARPAFDPARHLADHGVNVQTETIEGSGANAGDAILASASRHRADLLVSGIEGKRSRGDCHLAALSRHLVRFAALPLFMTC